MLGGMLSTSTMRTSAMCGEGECVEDEWVWARVQTLNLLQDEEIRSIRGKQEKRSGDELGLLQTQSGCSAKD